MSLDTTVIFEIVRSGDAMPTAFQDRDGWAGGTFAPDTPVMKCYWVHPEFRDQQPLSEGQTTIDYFRQDFYGPFTREFVDFGIEKMMEEYKSHEKV